MGTLKGYDQLMNLVLDNVKEITRGRSLGYPTIGLGELLTRRRRRREFKHKVFGAVGGAGNSSRTHLAC